MKKTLSRGRILNSLSARILLSSSIALLITFSITFYVVEKAHEGLVFKQVESQAKILFKQIVLTRRWIADHGGIFVEKLPWVTSNPYLKKSEIIDITGRRYVKENPAYVTRQLSEYSKREGLYWFHITSLRLVNPSNKPDEFERSALVRFENEGLKELSTIERSNGISIYRYIAPLYVEASCLECHSDYRVGSVRGAISVSIPINRILQNLSKNRWTLAAGALSISLSLLVFLYLSMNKLVVRPIKRLQKTMEGYRSGAEIDLEEPDAEELKSLYSTFTEMMDTIRRYHDSLEEEVKNATEGLRKANEKLLKVNQEYRELSARKSDFISSISHELRTPLTSIKGSISYIQQKLLSLHETCPKMCDIDEILSFMDIISSNAERLNRMVNETLDLEKIENGKMEFSFEHLYLDRILKSLTLEVMPLLDDKRLSLKTEIEDGLSVWADEDRIRQVILNFVTNAIQFSPEGDMIKLEAYRTGSWVVLSVTDSGPGIAYDKQQRVFDRFYKERKGGTGLGLAISKAIIRAHEGEIGVISNGKKGSTFYFKLPFYKGGADGFDSGG